MIEESMYLTENITLFKLEKELDILYKYVIL
jgi:hypothetical protein